MFCTLNVFSRHDLDLRVGVKWSHGGIKYDALIHNTFALYLSQQWIKKSSSRESVEPETWHSQANFMWHEKCISMISPFWKYFPSWIMRGVIFSCSFCCQSLCLVASGWSWLSRSRFQNEKCEEGHSEFSNDTETLYSFSHVKLL